MAFQKKLEHHCSIHILAQTKLYVNTKLAYAKNYLCRITTDALHSEIFEQLCGTSLTNLQKKKKLRKIRITNFAKFYNRFISNLKV